MSVAKRKQNFAKCAKFLLQEKMDCYLISAQIAANAVKSKMETVDFIIKFSDEHRVPLNDVVLILFFMVWVNYE